MIPSEGILLEPVAGCLMVSVAKRVREGFCTTFYSNAEESSPFRAGRMSKTHTPPSLIWSTEKE
jgi:hypothetical protein